MKKKLYEVTLHFQTHASVMVVADSEGDAENKARSIDRKYMEKQLQDNMVDAMQPTVAPIVDIYEKNIVDVHEKNGVILTNIRNRVVTDLFNASGYLVIQVGENIEFEDNVTGELLDCVVSSFSNDYSYMTLHNYANNVLLAEYNVPITNYLRQLKENGALDAYQKVNQDKVL